MIMKNFLLFIFFVTLISCKDSQNSKKSYANKSEKNIIDKMICWESYESESIMNQIINTDDKEERDNLFQKKFDLDEQASNTAKDKLKNDTIFINLIRNDSLLNDFKNQRNRLAKKILAFNKKVPFF